MQKNLEALLTNKVKSILEKDTLTDDDLIILILYKDINRISPIDRLLSSGKKILDFLNKTGE